MNLLLEYRCKSCDTKEEYWVKRGTTQVRCKICDGSASRVLSGGKPLLDPLSGDFPGATIKWARHHEKMAKAND